METQSEFDKRHGGNGVRLGNWLYFANGARRECVPMGVQFDPPADKYEKAKLVLRYWTEVVKRFEKVFHEKKANLLARAKRECEEGGILPDDDKCLDELKQLKAEVTKSRRQLASAQERVDDLTPDGIAEDETLDEETLEEAERFIAEVEKLKI